MTSRPSISVVIPAYNRSAVLARTIDHLVAQDYPHELIEILVVDNSSDDTPAVVRDKARSASVRIELIEGPRLPAIKRNIGLHRASGELVMFMNDDVWLAPDALAEHARSHEESAAPIAVLGHVRQSPEMPPEPFCSWLEPFAYHQIADRADQSVPYQYFWTMNISLPRHVMLERNLVFHEDWREIGEEDIELGYRWTRAGLDIIYNPRISGDHYHPHTLASASPRPGVDRPGLARLHRVGPRPPRARAVRSVRLAQPPEGRRPRSRSQGAVQSRDRSVCRALAERPDREHASQPLDVLEGHVALHRPRLADDAAPRDRTGADVVSCREPRGVLVQVPRARRHHLSRSRAALIAVLLVAVGAMFGALGGRAGFKGLLGVVVLFTIVGAWLMVHDRELLVLAGLPLSVGFLLHKSIGTRALDVNSGATAIYISTTGAVLLVLIGFWIVRRRSVWADISDAFSEERVLWVPVIGALLMLPSLLVTAQPGLAWAELVRMVWMYLLFVYLAARIRRREQVWTILAAFGVLALGESLVVAGQWITKSTLGLGFLGLPSALGERVISASGDILRPFGTIVHPVFLAAVMGPIAIMALSVAIHVPNVRIRVASLLVFVAGVGCIGIAQARAGALALVVGVIVLVWASVAARRLAFRTVVKVTGGLAIAGVIAAVPLYTVYRENFQTAHFSLEVTSRVQLNTVALQMWADHPFFGVGLNSFQRVMGQYDRLGLLFAGNPVHNIYLLQAAETGVLGLVGLLLVGIALLFGAIELAKSPDRLYSAVGYGFAVVVVFFAVQEMLLFALRVDQPLTVWWLMAGLMVACRRLARRDGGLGKSRRRGRHDQTRPAAPSGRAAQVSGRHRPQASRTEPHAAPHCCRRLPSKDSALRGLAVFSMAAAVIVAPIPGGRVIAEADPGATRITFTAVAPGTAASSIYVANGDGTDVLRITNPADGVQYFWSEWAMGTSHIVYSARKGPVGGPENIFVMRADGTDRRQLTFGSWPSSQPKISPDGRSLVFASLRPDWNLSAIYKLDLDTLQITNLSAALPTPNYFDADPRWSPDGSRIIFSHGEERNSSVIRVNQIWSMAPDGTDRQRLTNDAYFNVDAMYSPNGKRVVYSSYRGTGNPRAADPVNVRVKLHDWQLTLLDPASGHQTELTKGLACYTRPPSNPCAPNDGSGYDGTWSPDGKTVAFIGTIDRQTTCICKVDPTGHNPGVILEVPERLVVRLGKERRRSADRGDRRSAHGCPPPRCSSPGQRVGAAEYPPHRGS